MRAIVLVYKIIAIECTVYAVHYHICTYKINDVALITGINNTHYYKVLFDVMLCVVKYFHYR